MYKLTFKDDNKSETITVFEANEKLSKKFPIEIVTAFLKGEIKIIETDFAIYKNLNE